MPEIPLFLLQFQEKIVLETGDIIASITKEETEFPEGNDKS